MKIGALLDPMGCGIHSQAEEYDEMEEHILALLGPGTSFYRDVMPRNRVEVAGDLGIKGPRPQT